MSKAKVSPCFSPEEIYQVKNSSIQFPQFVKKETQSNAVVQINEVVGLTNTSADPWSQPQEITIYQHIKGEGKRRLVFKLVESNEMPNL